MSIYDVNGNKLIADNDIEQLDDLLPNRLLIWHDEFHGANIDKTKWQNWYGKSRTYLSYAQNIERVTEVADGLRYRCIKDNPHSNILYSCPFLVTKDLFEFRYGRIEAKMRFPSENPYHSTFWTLGANNARKLINETTAMVSDKGVVFPSCGEIDIAEFNNGTVGARTHWATRGFDEDGETASGGNVQSLTSTPTNWHIYSCEWTNESISFFVDGVQKNTWDISDAEVDGWNPFNHPHFLMLNCIHALSGLPSWDVAETDVAWVRVYAPVGVTEYIEETAISIPASASIAVGERHWLGTPTFTPANPSDMTIQWLSHNEDIVTCYGGMLIGVSAGTTYVQATSKHGYTALCKVTVS